LTLPIPETPAEFITANTFATVPLSEATVLASMVPVVRESSAVKLVAVTEVSDKMTASFPSPLHPLALYIVVRSANAPLTVATAVASTVPDVAVFTAFRVEAVELVSVRLTLSFPKPLMPADKIAVVTSAAAPVTVVMLAALIVPVVAESMLNKFVAVTVSPVRFTLSFPSPV